MASPSKPSSTALVNPDLPSSPTAEEEAEVNAPGKFLPVFKWSESSFNNLMTSIQMPAAYGARYPQEGDTVGDAPEGYVNMFADWFDICNLRLPLTIFMVELLEYYKIHISQLSPLGMVRALNFECTFRAQNGEPLVEDFRRFYQMTEQLGFFSFRVREGALKFMSPPKDITKWKTKFFYVKAAAVTARLHFRNVRDTIVTKQLSTPEKGKQAWFSHLHVIASQKLENRQLWILRMMLGSKLGKKAKPVLREKNEDGLAVEAPLWRMFCRDFEGKTEIVKCGANEEGWNEPILSNFRVPDEAALNAFLPEGKGYLGALGDPDATGVPKAPMTMLADKHKRKKKAHAAVTLPPLVLEASGTFLSRLRKYEDYVVVSDTLECLSVPGGSSGAGGAAAGTKPVDDKKRKGDTAVGGGEKAPKLRKTRATVISKHKPEGSAEPLKEPSSPSKVVDAEAQKKGGEDPSIEVLSSEGTPPTVRAEQLSKKTGGDTIFDTLDSSNNLIDPRGEGDKGGEKPKSPVYENVFGSTATGKGVEDQPPIQPDETELDYYYRSYSEGRSFTVHHPLGVF
ncbi:hypothetical protein HanPI659440_Chr13g0504421 [Helianthus annuus]|nr:hypothetical protein HanPI659440_Chr13g0504421 [Helianthus annuus]